MMKRHTTSACATVTVAAVMAETRPLRPQIVANSNVLLKIPRSDRQGNRRHGPGFPHASQMRTVMFTSFPYTAGQPPLPPPGPSHPRDYPPPGPQDPFPFDTPDRPPPPLNNNARNRLTDGRSYPQGTMAMQDRPDPDKAKPQTPAEKQEDEGRDEALDESFPASDPPSQGRTTGPNK